MKCGLATTASHFDFVNVDVGTLAASAYGVNTGVTNPLAGGLPSIVITGLWQWRHACHGHGV